MLKLAAGASHATVLPFGTLYYPTGVAVDAANNVYVLQMNPDPVLKLAAGASAPSAAADPPREQPRRRVGGRQRRHGLCHRPR